MAIYGHKIWSMAEGNACHIYLNKEQALILDAISGAMGKRYLGVEPKRSQLIRTAVRNFINECEKAEEDLREAIKEARLQLAAEKKSSRAS